MADQASKSGERKPPANQASPKPAASGPITIALAMVKAYKWPIVGATSALVLLGAGSYWYFFHQTRPDPPVLLARALECLKDRDNAEATVEARRIASELDGLRYRDPEF